MSAATIQQRIKAAIDGDADKVRELSELKQTRRIGLIASTEFNSRLETLLSEWEAA